MVGNTRLVRLELGPGAPLYGKCEHENPGGSIKDRIARAIVDAALADGSLRPGQTIVEATAGNTGTGLCLTGHPVVCVMPEKMSHDKRQALRERGAQVVITPNAPPDSPDNFQNVARRLAGERGWFLADQFRNPANPRIHEITTAEEIWRDTGGEIGSFVAGAGTGGTITGVGRALGPRGVRIVLADPVGSRLARWVTHGTLDAPDGPYAVEGIGQSVPPANFDRRVVHAAETVSDEESFAMCRRLRDECGLFVGGSSGTAVAAALREAARVTRPVVVILADRGENYASTPWMQAW